MTNIKTWKEHLNELTDIQIVTNDDVRAAMLNEIDDLRAALVKSSEDVVNISRERNALKASADKWFDIAEKLWKEKCDLTNECTLLKEKITEMNLQYISDFGQLQEREPENTLSWDGFNVHGDKKSMSEVLRLIERCASLEQYLKAGPLTGEIRLWDSQWTNVVNHEYCYETWSKEDAVHYAVKMTEKLIAKNVAENNLPPHPKE